MNKKQFIRPTVVLFLACWALSAQTSATLVNAGYSKPTPFVVAPGQIVTFFFRGVSLLPNGETRGGDAKSLPLPASLAGLSLAIARQAAPSLSVPIMSVHQEKECDGPSPECFLTTIRAQVPFELPASTSPRLGPNGITVPDAQITLAEDGRASRTFLLRPVSENGHVITSCDQKNDTNFDSVCNRTAYHADGTPVSVDAPAAPGETILVYAFGLGQTTPPARTGEAATAGLSVFDPAQPRVLVSLRSDFLNASPSAPRFTVQDNFSYTPIEFAGLTPGQAGLYQINIPIPASFQALFPCGPNPTITANGLLQVITAQGVESVPICVAPPRS